jgi:hypothetical protein
MIGECSTDEVIRNHMKPACVLAKLSGGRTKHFSAMKIWLNELLENAAFPAIILAFACAPINNKLPDLRASRLTDQREGIANRGSDINCAEKKRPIAYWRSQ